MLPFSPYLVVMATEPPSTSGYEENICLSVLVVLIQRKSAVIILARFRKYKTTCLGPQIAGANTQIIHLEHITFQATNFMISAYNTQKHM